MEEDFIQKIFGIKGMTVAITGGGGVLGSAIACGLAQAGARVAILQRREGQALEIARRITGSCGEAIPVHCDVLDKGSVLRAVDQVLESFGRIDTLINAAGGNKPEATTSVDAPFFNLPEEALSGVFDLNMIGTILPSQVVGAHMARAGRGNIINISSMNSFRPLTRVPAYSAAKAAVSNFTQWLAVHMAQEYSPNIRVNAIAPGFFQTEQNRYLLTDRETGLLTPRGQAIISHTPAGRFGAPDDLLSTILWLLAPASTFITGIVVPIDGGFSAFSGV